MVWSRRDFLQVGLGGAVVSALPFTAQFAQAATTIDVGSARLTVLSDGHLQLPIDFLQPSNMSSENFKVFLNKQGITEQFRQSPCNLTLWQTDDRLVLFDVGSGNGFMDSAGELLVNLEATGIDPEAVTDVVITHAHPDHLWGLVDDFDELVFTNADYHVNEVEWNFWWDDNTVSKMPEARKVIAIGAKSRFEYLADQVILFRHGDEIIPGVEAVLTAGHTPGHSSLVLHDSTQSTMVVGDALTHSVLSFQPKRWLSRSDQDQELAKSTRIALLDRLAHDKMRIVGYHLPYPGLGFATRRGDEYQFEPV